MIEIKSILGFLVMILVLGAGLAIQPPTTNAQSNKENKENSQEREDDDNDADEKLSPEEAKQAKISLDEARAIALRRVAGKVIDEELEKENGRLQYAFDIRDAKGKLFDVEVDAATGAVLQATDEDDDADDKDDNDADEILSPEDAKQAKLSMAQARAVALGRISGTILEEDLEKENGRLQYAFDIKTADGKVFDVEIDAITGEVLQAKEGDDEDGDNDQSRLRKASNSVYRAANTVKNVTFRTFGKLFD